MVEVAVRSEGEGHLKLAQCPKCAMSACISGVSVPAYGS